MMKAKVYLFLSLLICLSMQITLAQDDVIDPGTLPRLPEESHVGTMFYGWGAPPPDVIQPRIDDATAAGMNAFTVYLDWPELEPSPGNYDFSGLTETLTWASDNGLSTFANITLVDIESLVLPSEFVADSSGLQFADDYSFANPDLIARFLFMMDEMLPILIDNGVFYLGLGNEVDGWLSENPQQLADYLAFIAVVREHIHRTAPDLAVGVTVTGNVPLYNPDYLQNFYPVTDIVSSNIYGIDVSDFTATNASATADMLEDFIAAFEGRPIVIPELGCVSAESMDSSPTLQRECFEVMFNILDDHPNVRFVTVFTFHDFEPSLCTAIQEAFGYDAGADFETVFDQRIADYLCTLGIVNADGSPKPAFDAFLDGIALLKET